MNDCTICNNPGEYKYRLENAEGDIKELDKRFVVTKKEIFKKFDRVNTLLIVTLTSAVGSLLLLVANLIIYYAGR